MIARHLACTDVSVGTDPGCSASGLLAQPALLRENSSWKTRARSHTLPGVTRRAAQENWSKLGPSSKPRQCSRAEGTRREAAFQPGLEGPGDTAGQAGGQTFAGCPRAPRCGSQPPGWSSVQPGRAAPGRGEPAACLCRGGPGCDSVCAARLREDLPSQPCPFPPGPLATGVGSQASFPGRQSPDDIRPSDLGAVRVGWLIRVKEGLAYR